MHTQSEKGFTLVEILIVAAIITVITAIAIPRMGFVFSKNRLRTSTSSVTSSLYLARMSAVNKGENYGVQFSGDGYIEIVRDPLGVYEVSSITNRIEEGIEFAEITFENWLAVFNSVGQLDKSCLPSGDLIGHVILANDKGDSTIVEVTFITGRIRETNL